MRSQQSTNTDSMLSDFSSTLLNVAANNQFTEDTIVNLSSRKYVSEDNTNLSSVLSQIQDNGPAYNESLRKDGQFHRDERTGSDRNVTSMHKQDDRLNPAATMDDNASVLSAKYRKTLKVNSFSTWVQLSLIIMVSVSAALVLFRIDSRTSNLEQALSVYDLNQPEANAVSSENILPEIDKLHAAIKTVQDGLQVVQTDYSTLDNRYEVAIEVAIEDALLNGSSTINGKKTRVNDLEKEIILLRDELATLKSTTKTSAVNINSVTETSKKNSLTVNVASLTNKVSAEELVNKLTASGLLPSIETAVVNDQRVYRVSVSGFVDMDAAKLFINTAAEQYGMKDSWIRKS